MRNRKAVFALLLFVAFVAAQGCGGTRNDPNGPPTYPAKATITYKGQPVEGANVTFCPVDSQGVAAYGRSNTNGVVELTSFENGDGAVAGSYRVVVSKLEQRMPDVPPELRETDPERYDDLLIKAGEKMGRPSHLLPAKYASEKTTDLTAEVRAGDENSFMFELLGDVK